jgi:integrase
VSDRLFKRGDVWYGWVYLSDGQRRKFSTQQTDYESARRVLKVRARQAASEADLPADPSATVATAITYLVEESRGREWADSTRVMFQRKGGHLMRLMGDRSLGELTKANVARYCDQRLKEGAARETVRKELVTLRAALREAERTGVIRFPPARVLPEFDAKYVPRTRWLTTNECDRLLAQLHPDRRRWVLVAVYAGCRLGEVERLAWDHVEQLRRGKAWLQVPGTKTKGSRRPVPVAGPLAAELARTPKSERVGPLVRPWSNITRDLGAACKRAGVPRVTANDLRRTFASWLKQRGVDSAAVAKLLGHTSTRMVDLVYGQLASETLASAVELLPQWDVFGTTRGALPALPGTPGTAGEVVAADEKPSARVDLSVLPRVPGAGIEPATRGFSVTRSRPNFLTARLTYPRARR